MHKGSLSININNVKANIAFMCKHVNITGLYVDSIHSYLLLAQDNLIFNTTNNKTF